MTALEPDLRDTGTLAPVDPAQLVAPELPELDLGSRIESNLSGQRQPSLPMPAGARPDTSAIITNLPNAQTALTRKYSRLGPALANLPAPVRASLMKMDMQRVNKGQYPLTDKETLAAVLAATRKEPTTPAKEDGDNPFERAIGMPGDALRDLTAVARAAPKMLLPTEQNPLWQELMALRNFGDEVSDSLAEGDNIITALADAPGVRFIPGSYVVGNLADGPEGWEELADHPGLAALDVLPYVGKAAKMTKVGQAAANQRAVLAFNAERGAQLRRGATEEAATAAAERFAARRAGAHPIFDVMTKRIDGEGNLTANALGRQAQALGGTRLGQFYKSAFSPEARRAAGELTGAEQMIEIVRKGENPLGSDASSLARFARRTRDTRDRFTSIPEARATAITREAVIGAPGWRERLNLTPDEVQFADEMRTVAAELQTEATRAGQGAVNPRNDEFYSTAGNKKIQQKEEAFTKARAKVLEDVRPRIQAEVDAATERVARLEASVVARGRARGLRTELSKARKDAARVQSVLAALDDALDPATPSTLADAAKAMRGLKARKTSVASPDATGTASIPAERVTRIDSFGNLVKTLDKAKKAEKAYQQSLGTPARWIPVENQLATERMVERMVAEGADEVTARAAVVAQDFDRTIPGWNKKAWREVEREIAGSWQRLKNEGYDPQYVPAFELGQEGKMWAGISNKNRTPSIAKERTTGRASSYGNMAIAYDAAAAELLRDEVQRSALDSIGQNFGKPWADVVQPYMAEAQRIVADSPDRLMAEGDLAVTQQATALAEKDWVEWLPDQAAGGRRGDYNASGRLWVPRYIDKVARDHADSAFRALNVLDPITGAFRISVLALSPRWHLYNIIGNALMLAGTEGPASLFRFASQARRDLQAAKRGESVLPREILVTLGSGARDLADDTAFMETARGARLRRTLADTAPARFGGRIVQGSYQLNGFFDDMTKVMAYRSGEARALKRGWDETNAGKAGLEAAQRASAFWIEMTPFERGVLRKVFPFYSFTKKIMGLIIQLPLDHPVRTSIMANIAAAELEDMGDGLPLDWLNFIPIGDADEQGNQRGVSMSGLNPFADAPSLFTLKGFLSGLNPVFNTALVQLGATEAGGPLAFGDRTYDPQTGKAVQAPPSILPSALTATVPQLGAALRAAGVDSRFNELARNNPDAAQRMIVGGLGFPTSLRTMNEAEVRMKTELARITAQNDAWRNALSTGDFSEAEKYPALQARIRQVQALSKAGLLNQYHPYTTSQTGLPGVASAFAGQSPWPT